MRREEMYQWLWERVEEDGKAYTAVITKGIHKGSRAVWNSTQEIRHLCGNAPEELWKEVQAHLWQGPLLMEAAGQEVFLECLMQKPRLVVLGGGHISRPISQMAKMLDFHVTVIDDREEFADVQRFPWADEVICCSYEDFLMRVPFAENTYYVIVTRGHQGDTVCVRNLLPYPCVYLGMIGSRKKVAATKEILLHEGYKKADIERIYAPIGLNIGAQTPAEIAVSILAQIIEVKNQKGMDTIEPALGSYLADQKQEAMLLTIIKKKGSSPRSTGSRMLVRSDGSIEGSIGGGSAEYLAIEQAKKNLQQGKRLVWQETFDMTNRESANTGMICGGTIKVLFEYLSDPEKKDC